MNGAKAAMLATAMLGECLWCTPLAAAIHSLESAVADLARQGQHILFSTDLVDPDTELDLAEVSLPELRRALRPLSLTLQRLEGHWVVTADTPANAALRLHIRSRDGGPLRDVRAQWREQTYPLAAQHDGSYLLTVPSSSTVTISAHQHLPLAVQLGMHTGELILEPVALVENMIVTGSRHHLAGRNVTGSVLSLDADDLATVPTLGSDGMRAAAQLPGMSFVGVSGKPHIRGGLQDELLVRLDGIELLDAYHLADFQNMFSVVDDRAVETVDVYTGGFPARYGNRLSGVLDIVTGRPGGERRSELGLSLFSVALNGQGTAHDGRIDYLASARRGNLDQLGKRVEPRVDEPRYYDAYLRVGHHPTPQARISAGAFLTRDDVTLDEGDETLATSDIDSRYLWTRLEWEHGAGLRSASTLNYVRSERAKRLLDQDEESTEGGFLDHRQNLWQAGLSSDWVLEREHLLMEFGAGLEYGRSRYDSVALVDRGLLGVLLTGSALDGHHIQVTPDGWSGGVYWSVELPLTESLALTPGLRWDFQAFDPNGRTRHWSPRLGLRWAPSDSLVMHVDAGRFHQAEALHELQAADGEAMFFPPQQANHVIAGIDWLPAARWEVELEAYDKHYRQTKTRYENLFNPFVLVPELEPDRIAIAPERARARGVDLELRHHLSERLLVSARYGYMDAEDRIDGDWVPRRWSQRHTAGALIAWHGERLTLAAALTWHSGWRSAELPPSVPAGEPLNVTDVLNNGELRDYVSVDVNVRRVWQVGRSTITAFASIINLGNRANVAGVEYDAEQEDDLVIFERDRETLLPLVPSVGILIAF